MRIKLPFSFLSSLFILSVFVEPNLSAQDLSDHVPENATDLGPELPVVGSSLFDKIFSKENPSGESNYEVPFPLSRLLKRISHYETEIVHTMLPFGRSLQRPRNLDDDPLLNPRIVLTPSIDPSGHVRGKIFLGYVKAKDQLEVISYNDEAGRFEFQLVRNYSQAPEVFYAPRGKCMTCHQGQAGIFSPPGWQDTSLGPSGLLIHKKLNLKGTKREKRRQTLKILFGNVESREEVAFFDSMVRLSNSISFEERIWKHGCGEQNICRLGLLLSTLAPNASVTDEYAERSFKIIDRSVLRGQKYFSSFISSVDMGVLRTITKYGGLERTVINHKALLEIISNIYSLSERDNPATLRDISLKKRDLTLRRLKTFSSRDLSLVHSVVGDSIGRAENTSEGVVEKVAETLIELYLENHPIFAPGSVNKFSIINNLLEGLGSEKSSEYRSWLEKRTPVKKLFRGRTPPIFKTKQLNILSRYCSQCHASGLRYPPQFLMGEEPQVLKKVTFLKDKIIHRLSLGQMPPNQKSRSLMIETGDRKRVLDFLKRISSE